VSNIIRAGRRLHGRDSMIAYAEPKIIDLTGVFVTPPRAPYRPITLERPPVRMQCPCGNVDIIALPNASGRLEWSCWICHRSHAIAFRPAGPSQPGSYEGMLQRKPILHECRGCGEQDVIILPAGTGQLKFTCRGPCGRTWGLKFTKARIDWYEVL